MAEELILGVDGGGSKTVAWLAAVDAGTETVLGKGLAGSSNMASPSRTKALEQIVRAVDAAFENAKLAPTQVKAACLGLAGAGQAVSRMQLLRWAHDEQLAERVKVVHDGESVLFASDADGVGIALIAGTGSLAYGRDSARREARCGGWGHVLGDEGSGYAIAIAGLRAAVRSADGRGARTGLLAGFLDRLECSAVSELTDAIYDPRVTRDVLASLAHVVFETAAAGDDVAEQLINTAATDLAEMVDTVCRKLGVLPETYRLVMTGGILVHQTAFRARIEAELVRRGRGPREVAVVEHSVVGTLRLAAAMLAGVES